MKIRTTVIFRIKKIAGQIDRREDPLDIRSHELCRHFKRQKIVPCLHPKYKDYFCDQPCEIAVTYQWSSSFLEIKNFLNKENIRQHNRTALDPTPLLWHRLYLMSFLWVLCGPLTLIPENIDECTIFIDILANDQNSIDIKEELSKSELEYQMAPLHIVLATRTVLQQAWCLMEIAVRRGAGGRSQLLWARTKQGARIKQLAMAAVGPVGVFYMMVMRAISVFSLPVHLSNAVLRLFGIDLNTDDYFSSFSSAGASAIQALQKEEFFEEMQATKDIDKILIRDYALKIFRSSAQFNATISAATVRTRCGRLELALLLWLEAVLCLAWLPAHLISAVLSLPVVVVRATCICCCNKCRGVYTDVDNSMSGISQEGLIIFRFWARFDVRLKLPLLAALTAAAAPAWAVVAVALTCLGTLCGSRVRCRSGSAIERAPSISSCRQYVMILAACTCNPCNSLWQCRGGFLACAMAGEMWGVMAAAFFYPIVAPFLFIAGLVYAFGTRSLRAGVDCLVDCFCLGKRETLENRQHEISMVETDSPSAVHAGIKLGGTAGTEHCPAGKKEAGAARRHPVAAEAALDALVAPPHLEIQSTQVDESSPPAPPHLEIQFSQDDGPSLEAAPYTASGIGFQAFLDELTSVLIVCTAPAAVLGSSGV